MEALANCGVGLAKALNTHIYGNGSQTVVLSHGIVGDGNIWRYIVPTLAIFFKVLVYDLAFAPNVNPKLYNPVKYSNYSAYAKDLTCILDELRIHNTVFVGHSMSAMIGCLAATKRPDLFEHLVLLNGSPRYLNDTDYIGGFSRAQLEAYFNTVRTNFTASVPSLARQQVGVNNAAAIEEIERGLLRLGPERAESVGRTAFLADNRNILPKICVPCTIIQSRKDPSVPKTVPDYMEKKLPRADAIILKTNGHYPMLTDVKRLLHALNKVLRITKV